MKKICLFTCALIGLMACNGMTVSANNSAYRSLKDIPPLQTIQHPTLTTTDGTRYIITDNNRYFSDSLCSNYPPSGWVTINTTEGSITLASSDIKGITFITDGSDTSLGTIGNYFLALASNFDTPLILPDRVQNIGSYFLFGCSKFNKNLSLPSSLILISPEGFMYRCNSMCRSLNLGSLAVSVFNGTEIDRILSADTAAVPMYTTGIAISGTNAAAFRSKFYNFSGPAYFRTLK